ncbi:Bifunctional protein RIB2 [Phytophthora citrophthora]|uniref:Bifunctional protein RIB2 n=1 Tax=Phytophthora citrophthora TaxID=4793 RepID=A0AAD9FYL3_9STRA|nr:Bifunctional protein RIB2 [Phytophthora citrophthora]
MADAPPPSKKQLRKQEKARWLAERKTALLAEGNNVPSKRKRRNQRQNRATASAVPSAAVHYNPCTSSTCDNRVTGSVCIVRSIGPYVHRFALFAKGRWAGRTLRELFASEFPTLSTDYCIRAAHQGLIRVNGEAASLDSVIKGGDFFEHIKHRHEPSIHLTVKSDKEMTALSTTWIHFETDELMVVDKPSGIPVHPTGSYQLNSLTFMLQHDRREGAASEESNEVETLELFPVHRLDRLTSGLLILAKTAEKARSLTAELTATSSDESAGTRSVQKFYVARVKGEFPDTEVGFAGVDGLSSGLVKIEKVERGFWRITAPIGLKEPRQGHLRCVIEAEDSKPCVTLIRRREAVGGESIVECLLVTGRTHQIRVHLQHLGFPIANDPLYGVKTGEETASSAEQGSKDGKLPNVGVGYPADGEGADDEDDGQRCIRVCDICRADETKENYVLKMEDTVLWLHSYRYESPQWSFDVPLPHWAVLQ